MPLSDSPAIANYSSNPFNDDMESSTGFLRHISPGEIWTLEDVEAEQQRMLRQGRQWHVVENLIVHECIKTGTSDSHDFLGKYEQSLVNLSKAGITTVYYNFTPIFHGLRTHFINQFPGSRSHSFFDLTAFSVFDIFILKRPQEQLTYTDYQKQMASCFHRHLSAAQLEILKANVLACVQTNCPVSLEELRSSLEKFRYISTEELTSNFRDFARRVQLVANSLGINFQLYIDNPYPGLLGLPWVETDVL